MKTAAAGSCDNTSGHQGGREGSRRLIVARTVLRRSAARFDRASRAPEAGPGPGRACGPRRDPRLKPHCSSEPVHRVLSFAGML